MSETFTESLMRRFVALIETGSRGQRSQRAIAREIGLNHATLSRWRGGTRKPDARSIDKILSWVALEEQRDRRSRPESTTSP